MSGDVVQLNREPDEFDVKATILAVLEGELTRFQVIFAERDYDAVIKAFQSQSKISVRGDIYRYRGSHELRNPRNLTPLTAT